MALLYLPRISAEAARSKRSREVPRAGVVEGWAGFAVKRTGGACDREDTGRKEARMGMAVLGVVERVWARR